MGAFWEDRYHATAIEADEHLHRCLVYIDLNMVRTGVVSHPREWECSGYREIQHPPERYAILDLRALTVMCGFAGLGIFNEHMASNKPESVKTISEWLKMDSSVADVSYDIYWSALSDDGLVSDRALMLDIGRTRDALKIKDEIPLSRVVDFSLLKETQSTAPGRSER